VYRRLAPLAPAGLGRLRSGDLLSRFVADVDSLQHLFLRALAPPLVALGTIAIAVAAAGLILPAAAVALAIALLLAATAVPLVGWLATRASGRGRSAAQGDLTAELVDVLRGAPELVAYGRADAYRERLAVTERRLARLTTRDAAVAGLTGGLGTLIASATVAAGTAPSALSACSAATAT
jgi:ABC-type transport system involved in cytochrome bd biosynthesis fused ATPase/permease subunit